MTSKPYAEVIGDPIVQSLSPTIHSFWLEALGIDATYGRRQVSRAELPAYLEERRADPDWRGSNVTMPLKLDAAALADEVTDRAVAAGAANVLMMRDGRLAAANTDVGAIAILLTRLYDWINTPEGSLVVKKDPLEYLRKMRFHRQVRSAGEYGLRGLGA